MGLYLWRSWFVLQGGRSYDSVKIGRVSGASAEHEARRGRMGRVIRILVMVGVALGLAAGVASAGTKEVIVVTSFPKELFENYRKAFEAKHPGVTMVINAKQTNAGVT